MKKVFGILIVACICIALGFSVGWFRERNISLVDQCALIPFSGNRGE